MFRFVFVFFSGDPRPSPATHTMVAGGGGRVGSLIWLSDQALLVEIAIVWCFILTGKLVEL